MTPATRRQHRRCRFYLAEWCHLYLALRFQAEVRHRLVAAGAAWSPPSSAALPPLMYCPTASGALGPAAPAAGSVALDRCLKVWKVERLFPRREREEAVCRGA